MELEARIGRLERENRILKRLGVFILGICGLTVLVGQAPAPPKVVSAQRFSVVDEKGRERAVFGIEDGSPHLVLNNSRGRGVLQLQVPTIPDKAALYMHDQELSSGLELAMTMNGPVLHLTDKSGTRVRLATNELNAPLAAVYDAEGKVLFDVKGK